MLYLIRHAQAAGNAEGRVMGQLDQPLTDLGRRQAEALAAWFAAQGTDPLPVYASDLQRAVETAAPLAAARGGLPLRLRPDLRELGRGVLQGRTLEEAAEMRSLPGVLESFEAEAEVAERIRRAGSELRAAALEGDVAAVAHGGSIGRLLRFYLGFPSGQADGPRFRLDNTGLTALDFGRGGTEVLCVNSLCHVPPTRGRQPR